MKNPWKLVRWGIALARLIPGVPPVVWCALERAVDAVAAGDESMAAEEAAAAARGQAAGAQAARSSGATAKPREQAAGAAANRASKGVFR